VVSENRWTMESAGRAAPAPPSPVSMTISILASRPRSLDVVRLVPPGARTRASVDRKYGFSGSESEPKSNSDRGLPKPKKIKK
jgi:hypothetical protein